MQLRVLLLAWLATVSFASFSQTILVQHGVNLPPDTAVSQQLLTALNAFTAQKENANSANVYVLKGELLSTSALLDEMKAIEHSSRPAQKNAYQPYLTNIVAADGIHFILQLAYMGINERQPILQAAFELRALRQGTHFSFYSPMHAYTQSWHTKKLGDITFYYKEILHQADARAYQQAVDNYDKKLHAPHEPVVVYYADDFTEVQHLLGINYKAAYNGQKYNNLTAHEHDTTLVINGWNDEAHRFDPHDLWHERLRTVMKPELINRPVDEGCAYLYGGSWG